MLNVDNMKKYCNISYCTFCIICILAVILLYISAIKVQRKCKKCNEGLHERIYIDSIIKYESANSAKKVQAILHNQTIDKQGFNVDSAKSAKSATRLNVNFIL